MNLIFDWSGTLADDERLTFELTRDCVAHFGGGPIDWKTYRAEFTIPVDGFYGKHCPGTDVVDIDAWFFDAYAERLHDVRMFERLPSVIAQLSREHRLFVLSTLKGHLISSALAIMGLEGFFTEVVGGAFDKRDHLPALLERNGCDPMETMFIGDTPHDVATGRAAGVQTAAVAWGYTDPGALLELCPDHLFEESDALSRHLDVEASLDVEDRPIATSGGLVFRPDGRALFIKTDKWLGKWGTPGGKIRCHERMDDAFIREVKEETGLDAENVEFVLAMDAIRHPEFYKPRHFLLLNFVGTTPGGEVRLNYEASASKWATLEEATELDLNEPTRQLVEELLELPQEGTIKVADLRVTCIVGILPHERENEQDLLVDVELNHDFAAAAATEDVTTTVDYAEVSQVLTEWMREKQFQLIETMAVEGCDLILERWPGVTCVKLTIKKPDAVEAARHTAVSFEKERE
ncbi:MAG: dihydroneopterin aldolase [Planctomycetes bacterium]|nr:dihydroneopterin aldolase [Planctomycetota bacterium]